MRAHILITNRETFPVVRDNGFWGVGVRGIPGSLSEVIRANLENSSRPYLRMIADILGTRIDDPVFLYEREVGFHGVYKVASEPFFDSTPIGCIDGTWPLRIQIEPLHYFPRPVPEDYLFSTKQYESRFWGWFYRKIQGPRGVNTIDPEAAEALMELLVKVNGNARNGGYSTRPYPASSRESIVLPLEDGETLPLEDMLRAWLIGNLDDPAREDIRSILGPSEDLEWFANNVPYHVTRKAIDILCYHRNAKYTGFPLRYKFSVLELKRGPADDRAVSQLIDYCKWVAGRLAGSDIETVQPILIASRFQQSATQKASNSDFSQRGVILVSYTVRDNGIHLTKEEL